MRRALTMLLAVGLLGMPDVTTATAASFIPGHLTKGEYRLLTDSQAETKKAFARMQPDWSEAHRACAVLGRTTQLMQAAGASCLNELTDFETWLVIPVKESDCAGEAIEAAAGADGLSASGLDELACTDPVYQALAREVAKLYAGDVMLREVGVKRGFNGKCLTTLTPTKQQLFFENRYADAAWRFASELTLLVRSRAIGASPNSVAPSKLAADLSSDLAALERARNAWLKAAIGYPLSVCPHG